MQVSLEARKGPWIPWNWSYRQLWAACLTWVLETKLRSSANALNHCVSSLLK